MLAAGGPRAAISLRSVAARKRRSPTACSAARKAALDPSYDPTISGPAPLSKTPSSRAAPSLTTCGRLLSCVWKRQAGKRSSPAGCVAFA